MSIKFDLKPRDIFPSSDRLIHVEKRRYTLQNKVWMNKFAPRGEGGESLPPGSNFQWKSNSDGFRVFRSMCCSRRLFHLYMRCDVSYTMALNHLTFDVARVPKLWLRPPFWFSVPFFLLGYDGPLFRSLFFLHFSPPLWLIDIKRVPRGREKGRQIKLFAFLWLEQNALLKKKLPLTPQPQLIQLGSR